MSFSTSLGLLFVANLLHRVLYPMRGQIVAFLVRSWHRIILRQKDYVYIAPYEPNISRQHKQGLEDMKYTVNLVFWNALTLIAVLAYHSSVIKLVCVVLLAALLYAIGLMRVIEEQHMEKHYVEQNVIYKKEDYEVRNVNLAQAIVDLEKEVLRLKKICGEPIKPAKKKRRTTNIQKR